MTTRPNVGINIAGTAAVVDAETIAEIGDQIVTIFNAAFDTHQDGETVRIALALLRSAAETSAPGVAGMSISGSSISMGETT